ncbi:MAG: helix-turn-helix transcriptional regulator [Sedimentisphaerales bacterium]|nr:helix-turn-helix transcriptional regulator [Sedimentisphaerales bacterium]
MGTVERRQREAGRRRESILAAARKVFWQQGYAGTTIPQIAGVAELAPGTIYLYFPSKDALYVELLMEGYDILLGRLKEQVAAGGSAYEQAERLIEVFFGFAREYPHYYDIIFFLLQRDNTARWQIKLPGDQIAKLMEKEEQCKQVAAQILDRVEFGDGAERAAAVEAAWSMLAGVVLYKRKEADFRQVCEQAKKLLLAAVFMEERMKAEG